MKIGIVKKLFLLTTGLCLFILLIIFVLQTFFFKNHYTNRKVNDIQIHLEAFHEQYLTMSGKTDDVLRMTYDFTQAHNTWLTVLDVSGNLKYADDFHVEADVFLPVDGSYEHLTRTIRLPLYQMVNLEEWLTQLETLNDFKGGTLFVVGVEHESTFIPAQMTLSPAQEADFELMSAIHWSNPALSQHSEFSTWVGRGIIKQVNLPDLRQVSTWIYENPLFLGMIREFQRNLLLNEVKSPVRFTQTPFEFGEKYMTVPRTPSGRNQVKDRIFESEPPVTFTQLPYEHNKVDYMIFIDPIKDGTEIVGYLFAVTSLQPVDEAIQMIQDYFIYVVLAALGLTFLVSIYYSKLIAKPLLKMNEVTHQLVALDFSESLSVHSKDEIGDLARNINQMSATLYAHFQQLEDDIEKERALETTRKEFISNVSHELKTPLSVMNSCLSILKDGVAPEKRAYYFEAMEQEVDRMNLLIVDMLELAKLESGTYDMTFDVFDLDQIIKELIEKLTFELEEKALKLQVKSFPIQVCANERYIERVLTNFLTNAIAYTPKGEVIQLFMEKVDGRVLISVENKGVHLPKDQLQKVWDQFFRGDSARKRAQGGTGLGLAISKNILELHQTEYGVKNTEDGVLFYFYLNLEETAHF